MGHGETLREFGVDVTSAIMVERENWMTLSDRSLFPRLYAILDAQTAERRGLDLFDIAAIWRDAGIGIVQYRDKISSSLQVMSNAARLRQIFSGSDTLLVLNDSPTMARDTGVQGVHIGQTDGTLEAALKSVDFVGISTHSESEVRAAEQSNATYVAIGPVFATATKRNPEPVVGLHGVSAARALTSKPLVGIGGITLANAASVIEAGADSVAVISSLLDGNIAQRARDFLAALR